MKRSVLLRIFSAVILPADVVPSFFCAMIAAITLRFLDPLGTGKLVLFQVTYDKVILCLPFLYVVITTESSWSW